MCLCVNIVYIMYTLGAFCRRLIAWRAMVPPPWRSDECPLIVSIIIIHMHTPCIAATQRSSSSQTYSSWANFNSRAYSHTAHTAVFLASSFVVVGEWDACDLFILIGKWSKSWDNKYVSKCNCGERDEGTLYLCVCADSVALSTSCKCIHDMSVYVKGAVWGSQLTATLLRIDLGLVT